MKNILALLVSLMMVFVSTLPAHALLSFRLRGLAVYDDDLDLTWLADANAGAGSSDDDGFSTTDGRMSFQRAVNWTTNLTVGGFTGWRLPTTTQPDPTCVSQLAGTPPQGLALGCTGSEMGHFYKCSEPPLLVGYRVCAGYGSSVGFHLWQWDTGHEPEVQL